MRYAETIEITAPAEIVWSVVEDVERWPMWTRSMRSVELDRPGPPLAMGATARIRQPRLPTVVWEVTSVVPGRSFRWEASSPGIETVADHAVAPGDGGRTILTLSLRQEGPAARIAHLLLSRVTRRYLRIEAEGLRRRSEELVASADRPARGDVDAPVHEHG